MKIQNSRYILSLMVFLSLILCCIGACSADNPYIHEYDSENNTVINSSYNLTHGQGFGLIASSNITLDFENNTLNSLNEFSKALVSSNEDNNYTNITIKNLVLTNFTEGIYLNYIDNLKLVNVKSINSTNPIYISNSDNLVVENCEFINCSTGLKIKNISNSEIKNCLFNLSKYGLNNTLDLNNSVIDSCVFTNGVLGIMFETNTIYNITNNTFKNNKFINNSEYSIYCDEFKECENNTLENNEFINCTYYTVVFIGTGDSYFNHNDIKNNKFMNIYNLENSWNGCAIKVESTTIENMAITNNTINNCSDCGMYICEECIGTNNTISQNTISNCRDGISLETTGVHIYLNNLQNNRYAISPYSVSSNYPHSPIMTFAYNGKSYTGRLGNYYGEDLGDSNNGIYVKPQGGIGVVPR